MVQPCCAILQTHWAGATDQRQHENTSARSKQNQCAPDQLDKRDVESNETTRDGAAHLQGPTRGNAWVGRMIDEHEGESDRRHDRTFDRLRNGLAKMGLFCVSAPDPRGRSNLLCDGGPSVPSGRRSTALCSDMSNRNQPWEEAIGQVSCRQSASIVRRQRCYGKDYQSDDRVAFDPFMHEIPVLQTHHTHTGPGQPGTRNWILRVGGMAVSDLEPPIRSSLVSSALLASMPTTNRSTIQ